MDVKLVNIEAHTDHAGPNGNYPVSVVLDISGRQEQFGIIVHVNTPFEGASLLEPDERLSDRFRLEQFALGRICRIVGRQLEGQDVQLPQLVAA